MKLPRPLQDRKLLEMVDRLDRHYATAGRGGSFAIEFHYGQGEPRKAKLTGVELEFEIRKDLTPEEARVEDGALT